MRFTGSLAGNDGRFRLREDGGNDGNCGFFFSRKVYGGNDGGLELGGLVEFGERLV